MGNWYFFTFPFLWLFEHTLFFFQLERTYQQKSDSLLHKERNSIERMQREQDVGLINTVYCTQKVKVASNLSVRTLCVELHIEHCQQLFIDSRKRNLCPKTVNFRGNRDFTQERSRDQTSVRSQWEVWILFI